MKGGLLLYRRGGEKVRYLSGAPSSAAKGTHGLFNSLHGSMKTRGFGEVLKLVRQRHYWSSLHGAYEEASEDGTTIEQGQSGTTEADGDVNHASTLVALTELYDVCQG